MILKFNTFIVLVGIESLLREYIKNVTHQL